jgi:hypothetical protein
MKVNLVFNVAWLTCATHDPITGKIPSELTLIIVDDHEEYIIGRFIDAIWYGRHFQYKVSKPGPVGGRDVGFGFGIYCTMLLLLMTTTGSWKE